MIIQIKKLKNTQLHKKLSLKVKIFHVLELFPLSLNLLTIKNITKKKLKKIKSLYISYD
jgi:hypothetical protein